MSEQQLTIGELFPGDDLVAQWMFLLSMVVDDLQMVQQEQKAAIVSGGDPRRMLFFQRVLTIRLYEARRLVYVVDSQPAIASFIAQNDFFEQLRRYYHPIGASAVDQLYGVLRHQSVHYMWPGSDELASALRVSARLPATMKMSKDPPRVDVEWAQGFSGLATLGEFSAAGWSPKIQERSQLAAAIQQQWTMLFAVMIMVYARRRGIPLKRFSEAVRSGPETG